MRARATGVQHVFHGGSACGHETLPQLMKPSRTTWCNSNERRKVKKRDFTHRQGRRAEGKGVGRGAEIVGYAIRGRCGHRIAITRRAEENDGDHDCMLVVRAYCLRGNNRIICLEAKGGGNAS